MKSKKEIEITLKENKGADFVLPMTWDVMFEQMFISKEAMPLLEHIIAVFGNIDINDVKGKVRLLPNELKQTLAKDTRSKSDIIADYFKDEKNTDKYIVEMNSSKKMPWRNAFYAYKVAGEMGLKNKINTSMEVCIFKIMDIYNINKVISIMKDNIKSRFSSKGKKIIDINNKVVDNSLKYLKKICIDSSWVKLEYSDNKKLNFNETINLLKGDTLPVSSFLDVSNGVFEGGTTKNEKRNIAESIPNWIPENCSECNKCAFACPHGVIRPFLLDKDDKKIESIPSIMPKDVNFAIGINYEECTGCGLCAVTCPGKMGKKALEMVSNKRHDKEFDYLLKNNINDKYDSNILTSRNISFRTPKFEYSGACAGCGETPYLTNLTRVFNDNLVIANATGCSSIYGGSTPSFPYSIPWASSLFEDNAEYGYGILNGINMKRDKIKKYMKEYPRNKVFKKWLNNMNNYDICKEENKLDVLYVFGCDDYRLEIPLNIEPINESLIDYRMKLMNDVNVDIDMCTNDWFDIKSESEWIDFGIEVNEFLAHKRIKRDKKTNFGYMTNKAMDDLYEKHEIALCEVNNIKLLK